MKRFKQLQKIGATFSVLMLGLALLVPNSAYAVVTDLATMTPTELANLTAAQVGNITQLQIWLKVLRGVMALAGSGIAIGAFMMFGENSEKPNPKAVWTGIIAGVMIIIGGFLWTNNIILFLIQTMF